MPVTEEIKEILASENLRCPECVPSQSAVNYIDKEAAKKAVRDAYAMELFTSDYEEIDNAIDALPVVKIPTLICCKYCRNGLRNRRDTNDHTVFCMKDNMDREPDFYCSDGVVKCL